MFYYRKHKIQAKFQNFRFLPAGRSECHMIGNPDIFDPGHLDVLPFPNLTPTNMFWRIFRLLGLKSTKHSKLHFDRSIVFFSIKPDASIEGWARRLRGIHNPVDAKHAFRMLHYGVDRLPLVDVNDGRKLEFPRESGRSKSVV